MGGEKFDTPHPEGYLFGENMDLNFLGNRPVQVGLSRAGGPLLSAIRVPAARMSGHDPNRAELPAEGVHMTCAWGVSW